jgi:hypothetical protein
MELGGDVLHRIAERDAAHDFEHAPVQNAVRAGRRLTARDRRLRLLRGHRGVQIHAPGADRADGLHQVGRRRRATGNHGSLRGGPKASLPLSLTERERP